MLRAFPWLFGTRQRHPRLAQTAFSATLLGHLAGWTRTRTPHVHSTHHVHELARVRFVYRRPDGAQRGAWALGQLSEWSRALGLERLEPLCDNRDCAKMAALAYRTNNGMVADGEEFDCFACPCETCWNGHALNAYVGARSAGAVRGLTMPTTFRRCEETMCNWLKIRREIASEAEEDVKAKRESYASMDEKELDAEFDAEARADAALAKQPFASASRRSALEALLEKVSPLQRPDSSAAEPCTERAAASTGGGDGCSDRRWPAGGQRRACPKGCAIALRLTSRAAGAPGTDPRPLHRNKSCGA